MKPRRGEKKTNRRVSVSARPRVPIITLLTDFGITDYFVGSVKGVILTLNPQAHIVDLTHDIAPQDIEAAAFTLLAAYKSFPAGTVHVAVVDPGVGSTRRGIVVEASEQHFVGPDNGIFSYIFERESQFKVYELSNAKFFREPISSTFHGRDIFAPVAAALSNGVKVVKLGGQVSDPVRLAPLSLEQQGSRLLARIIHIDRFGNCVTNITPEVLTQKMIDAGAHLLVKGKKITSFRNFFAESGSRAHLFGVWGSAGFLEIAISNGSAAKFLNATRGQSVVVRI
ncbi:MAG TPA: SAM-dependent chlorinase/fluorinase [Pyrinomonadaceae bacterium]|nr:SAM-dependent chlorinase/fluorinase [Pyrinomonadaceae bacterium]